MKEKKKKKKKWKTFLFSPPLLPQSFQYQSEPRRGRSFFKEEIGTHFSTIKERGKGAS
jgi:hypothetical protein